MLIKSSLIKVNIFSQELFIFCLFPFQEWRGLSIFYFHYLQLLSLPEFVVSEYDLAWPQCSETPVQATISLCAS